MKLEESFPLSKIVSLFDKEFAGEDWSTYEVETLFLHFNVTVLSPLLLDKINLAKVVKHYPELYYNNFLFFLHAVEVMNGHTADFEHFPTPTSLELAFSIIDMAKTLGVKVDDSHVFAEEVRQAVFHVLNNEGYSVPVYPFNVVGVIGLTPGQTERDSANKGKAILEYVKAVYS